MNAAELTLKLKAVIDANLEYTTWTVSTPHLLLLVKQAVEEEREACAKVCDDVNNEYDGEEVSASWIAAAIRARGNT